MKVVHIVPGSGGTFYCQNCLRDGAFIQHLRSLGHDVVAVPMYLPFPVDAADMAPDVPIFFGAVRSYLGFRFPSLRLPRWLGRLLDSKPLLNWAAGREGSTSACDLEEMTISMLRGGNKLQEAELDRLTAWLQAEGPPDILHLSNCLLLGLAGRLKAALGSKVVCSLQDEDGWVNAMSPQAAATAWEIMADKARAVDAFTPVSRYYGQVMQQMLKIPHDKIHVVAAGMELKGYGRSSLPLDPPVIGYLSRMSESLGLGLLVDAYLTLRLRGRLGAVRMKVAGGLTAADKKFVRGLRRTLKARGFDRDVEFLPAFDRSAREEFLQQLSVLSVPVPAGEAIGAYLIEAMASGVPVVQPEVGGFPEIIAATGGGVTYAPNDAVTLAAALEALLLDRDRLHSLAEQGRNTVEKEFGMDAMVRNMLNVYRTVDCPDHAD